MKRIHIQSFQIDPWETKIVMDLVLVPYDMSDKLEGIIKHQYEGYNKEDVIKVLPLSTVEVIPWGGSFRRRRVFTSKEQLQKMFTQNQVGRPEEQLDSIFEKISELIILKIGKRDLVYNCYLTVLTTKDSKELKGKVPPFGFEYPLVPSKPVTQNQGPLYMVNRLTHPMYVNNKRISFGVFLSNQEKLPETERRSIVNDVVKSEQKEGVTLELLGNWLEGDAGLSTFLKVLGQFLEVKGIHLKREVPTEQDPVRRIEEFFERTHVKHAEVFIHTEIMQVQSVKVFESPEHIIKVISSNFVPTGPTKDSYDFNPMFKIFPEIDLKGYQIQTKDLIFFSRPITGGLEPSVVGDYIKHSEIGKLLSDRIKLQLLDNIVQATVVHSFVNQLPTHFIIVYKKLEEKDYPKPLLDPELIICSAIHYQKVCNGFQDLVQDYVHKINTPVNITKGVVVTGFRHNDCVSTAAGIFRVRTSSLGKHVQGFLTSKNRFVTRKEAMSLVLSTGQRMLGKLELSGNDLYSEHLY